METVDSCGFGPPVRPRLGAALGGTAPPALPVAARAGECDLSRGGGGPTGDCDLLPEDAPRIGTNCCSCCCDMPLLTAELATSRGAPLNFFAGLTSCRLSTRGNSRLKLRERLPFFPCFPAWSPPPGRPWCRVPPPVVPTFLLVEEVALFPPVGTMKLCWLSLSPDGWCCTAPPAPPPTDTLYVDTGGWWAYEPDCEAKISTEFAATLAGGDGEDRRGSPPPSLFPDTALFNTGAWFITSTADRLILDTGPTFPSEMLAIEIVCSRGLGLVFFLVLGELVELLPPPRGDIIMLVVVVLTPPGGVLAELALAIIASWLSNSPKLFPPSTRLCDRDRS
mmetsp:Transcript_20592/g.51965  ORF Transcript_20592/g.51965 Transcript_20592/m.51965 type:complete len:336 (-) Transcript_20592:465-1472(-)